MLSGGSAANVPAMTMIIKINPILPTQTATNLPPAATNPVLSVPAAPAMFAARRNVR